ncbi:protease complex subunit PrcB family protein [uncultured Ruminococcus sp.]|uniref:protease complex subunit PrcB family protein n=1 Tax=uncultured Ruminococcus sp. TaxID=165186 RepID=UPI0026256986|nr:protease complex subunit PrcB family protein [uncultured Ruminococcus sp.]
MNPKLLITAALCLFLTACGIDSSPAPAQQPTDQVTEQTAPAASICKATVTEITGNSMIVKPVEGSWELSSADQFSLSVSLLDEGVTPTVGMTLEITYDGGVMETYPAQFGNVQKVTIISALSNPPPADKGTLMNNLEYEISKGDSYNSQYRQRGYCIDVVDGKYQYTICSGERSTGGHGIKITRLDCLDCGTVIVTVEETTPSQDEAVTEAFTYPNCAIAFSHEPPDGIIIKSHSGAEFECLGSHTSTEDGKPLQYSLPRRAIMVDGTLYLDTGYVSSLMQFGTLDGNIERVIEATEIPDEDGEANFSPEGWQGGFEKGTLDVLIDNEFCIFAAEGSYTAEDGYILEGVMQFMATVDEVSDDNCVIVKTDTPPERFPQIQKDVRYRLSMDAFDPGIYTDQLVPGNVVIVVCKGNFEGEDPVTIKDVYTFSPVGSSPCQPYSGNIT